MSILQFLKNLEDERQVAAMDEEPVLATPGRRRALEVRVESGHPDALRPYLGLEDHGRDDLVADVDLHEVAVAGPGRTGHVSPRRW